MVEKDLLLLLLLRMLLLFVVAVLVVIVIVAISSSNISNDSPNIIAAQLEALEQIREGFIAQT